MTFEQAVERLPKCSYAVCEGSFLGDRTVEVWFLYFQDSSEVGDPRAEDGPAVQCEGSVVDRRGRVAGGGVEDWYMPSQVPDQVPEKAQNAEWHEAKIEGYDGFPTGFHANVILHVMEGASVEKAKTARGWPEKWRSFARG